MDQLVHYPSWMLEDERWLWKESGRKCKYLTKRDTHEHSFEEQCDWRDSHFCTICTAASPAAYWIPLVLQSTMITKVSVRYCRCQQIVENVVQYFSLSARRNVAPLSCWLWFFILKMQLLFPHTKKLRPTTHTQNTWQSYEMMTMHQLDALANWLLCVGSVVVPRCIVLSLYRCIVVSYRCIVISSYRRIVVSSSFRIIVTSYHCI